MRAQMERLRIAVVDVFRRFPWLGWAGWIVFCLIALARTHPRRFASTFTFYLEAAERLVTHQQVYDPNSLGEFLYFPIALVVLAPFTRIDPVIAAAITMTLYAGVFTWGCFALVSRLLPRGAGDLNALALAGVLLLINVPAAWFNFKGVQSQVIMTGCMLAAGAAMIRAQWLWASFWLFVAIVFKPLALVMVLLCVALCPRMRLPLIAAMVLAATLPFVFFDGGYLLEQYRDFGIKLWAIASVPAQEWIYRADLSTLLAAVGVQLPSLVSLAIRLAAALATLFLAWRVRGTGGARSFAFAVVILSACYINLFSPRNEFLSFVVLTPSLVALALVMLVRNDRDVCAWLLILAALVLGFAWNLKLDSWMKPAIVLAIYVWLAWLMIVPARWRDLVEAADAGPTGAPR